VIYATASDAECTCATTPPAASSSCCTCAIKARRCAARRVWSWVAASAMSVSLHHKGGREGRVPASLCKARRTRAKNVSWLLMRYAFFRRGTPPHRLFVLQGLLPALAKRPRRHRFEIPRLSPAGKRCRQPGEPALLHERLLGQGCQGDDRLVEAWMAHDPRPQRKQHPLSPGGIVAFDQLLSQIEQQVWDVDFHWARLTTGAAERASTRQVLGRIQAGEHRGEHSTNGTWVDPTIGVATNILINRADVQTGTTAQAVQG